MENGPGSVMINSPEMRKRANYLVFYFREESELPQIIQELAMILTARAKDCQYIWFAHAARARKEGISDAEQIVVDYATELFGANRVSDATFKAAIDHFGAQLLHLAPSSGDAEVAGQVSGLRPYAADGLPLIGPVPGWQGVYMIAGHFRSGMFLSAYSTRIIAALIAQGQSPIPIDTFRPGRFGCQA